MKIPQVLIGQEKEVRQSCSALARQFVIDRKVPKELLDNMVDMAVVAGNSPKFKTLFVMHPVFQNQEFFRPYSLPRELTDLDAFGGDQLLFLVRRWFDELVEFPWGILSLLTLDTILPNFKNDKARANKFFSNILKYWNLFEENQGFLESPDTNKPGQGFWSWEPTHLFLALAHSGVPESIIESRNGIEIRGEEITGWIRSYVLS